MDYLEELRGDMRDLKSNATSDPDDIAFGDRILWAIQEIERLRREIAEWELHGAAQVGALTPNELDAELAKLNAHNGEENHEET